MGARTRTNSRREGSTEPQEGPVTRSARRNVKPLEPGIPQRGTRRHRRRRSVESVATNDLYKSSPEPGTPDPRMYISSSSSIGRVVHVDMHAHILPSIYGGC